MKRMIDLTTTVPRRNSDNELYWVTIVSSEAYSDVMYSFTGNAKEYSEGRKENPRMSWRLKLEMWTKNIGVTDNSFSTYFLPLLPTPLSSKNIQKHKIMTSLKRI